MKKHFLNQAQHDRLKNLCLGASNCYNFPTYRKFHQNSPVNPREEPRNKPFGICSSLARNGDVVFGRVCFDSKEGLFNEDMFVLKNDKKKILAQYSPAEFSKKYPEYGKAFHKEDKSNHIRI